MSQHELDARGLLCPMPVIKVQNKVKSCVAGDELVVLATDPGTLQDIPSWCRIYGHEVVRTEQHNNEITIVVKVGEQT